MQLSLLFWNIWLNNQIDGPKGSGKLLAELEKIVRKYKPDCIGLNEVLQDVDTDVPFVLEFLNKLGYKHQFFIPASHHTDNWLIGTALASKLPLEHVEEIELGKDTRAHKRGYELHSVMAIAAKVKVGKGGKIGVIIAHPIFLSPSTIRDHYRHTKALTSFITEGEYTQNTIIGGDFNEPGLMPKSFAKTFEESLNYKTGSLKLPTWRYNASNKTPLRANLDKLFWTKAGTLELRSFEVVDTDISDHRPLFASFHIGS